MLLRFVEPELFIEELSSTLLAEQPVEVRPTVTPVVYAGDLDAFPIALLRWLDDVQHDGVRLDIVGGASSRRHDIDC